MRNIKFYSSIELSFNSGYSEIVAEYNEHSRDYDYLNALKNEIQNAVDYCYKASPIKKYNLLPYMFDSSLHSLTMTVENYNDNLYVVVTCTVSDTCSDTTIEKLKSFIVEQHKHCWGYDNFWVKIAESETIHEKTDNNEPINLDIYCRFWQPENFEMFTVEI